MPDDDTERFEELAKQFQETADEEREKAQQAEDPVLEASHYGWADALDHAWSELIKEVNDVE